MQKNWLFAQEKGVRKYLATKKTVLFLICKKGNCFCFSVFIGSFASRDLEE